MAGFLVDWAADGGISDPRLLVPLVCATRCLGIAPPRLTLFARVASLLSGPKGLRPITLARPTSLDRQRREISEGAAFRNFHWIFFRRVGS